MKIINGRHFESWIMLMFTINRDIASTHLCTKFHSDRFIIIGKVTHFLEVRTAAIFSLCDGSLCTLLTLPTETTYSCFRSVNNCGNYEFFKSSSGRHFEIFHLIIQPNELVQDIYTDNFCFKFVFNSLKITAVFSFRRNGILDIYKHLN